MSAIGYRECVAVLRGEMSLEAAKIQMRRLTRVFVRRQANWFKAGDPSIHWFESGKAKLEEIKTELSKIRTLIKAGGSIENPGKSKALKKAVARIETIIHEEASKQ